jgi:hypothetical protein
VAVAAPTHLLLERLVVLVVEVVHQGQMLVEQVLLGKGLRGVLVQAELVTVAVVVVVLAQLDW